MDNIKNKYSIIKDFLKVCLKGVTLVGFGLAGIYHEIE
jgi:hypothetical protein